MTKKGNPVKKNSVCMMITCSKCGGVSLAKISEGDTVSMFLCECQLENEEIEIGLDDLIIKGIGPQFDPNKR